jgi:acetylornithine deacetylase/succinyl-diaminopimelate desuccinylase-like protein
MASGPPSDFRRSHPRENPPANGASASHVAARLDARNPHAISRAAKIARPALVYAKLHAQRFLRELVPFLSFPSISNSAKHAGQVRECASWLADHLKQIGLTNACTVQTAGHPIVYASSSTLANHSTLLIYGHYDVQPVDPIREWHSPPFSPTRNGDNLIARGASDDKGQVFIHLKAIESYLAARGALPLNIKCVFEGEEESGSLHFAEFLRQNAEELRADFAVVSDTRMLARNRPVVIYGQRGLLSLELSVRGPRHDLHSGAFGGAIHNPAQALCEIVAQFHRRDGTVNIPGFYEGVRENTQTEREYFAAHAPSNQKLLDDGGTQRSWGEPGYSLFERTTIRPALTINGIYGGYHGPGGKGIIPAKAVAKISFRLVADQDPAEIECLFRRFVAKIVPPTVRASIRTLSRARPMLMHPKHFANHVAAWAYRKTFGTEAVFLRSGGTIPVVNSFGEILGVPTVLMGFALPDDRMHAPNEKYHLPTFHKGIATSIWFMAGLAGMRREQPGD